MRPVANGGAVAKQTLDDAEAHLIGALDGWEVARRARNAQPNLAIIYTTTADGPAFVRERVDRSVLLQKPYTLDRAVNAAREALRDVK
jgi:DNA-binding LytR/AlgR family response regulator